MKSLTLAQALGVSILIHAVFFLNLNFLHVSQPVLQFNLGKSVVYANSQQNVTLMRPQVQIDLFEFGNRFDSGLWKKAGSFSYLVNPGMKDFPKALSDNTLPGYPKLALERNWQGVCLIQAEIDSQGRIQDARLEKSSGYPILDQAAIDSVKTWQFTKVKSVIRIPVKFEIQ